MHDWSGYFRVKWEMSDSIDIANVYEEQALETTSTNVLSRIETGAASTFMEDYIPLNELEISFSQEL